MIEEERQEAIAKAEAGRQAAEAAAKAEEERQEVEAAAKAEAETQAAEAAAKADEERQAVEAAAKAETERQATEAATKVEEERQAVEAVAKAEAGRQAAEAAAKAEEERQAVEAAAKTEEESATVDAAAKAEAEREAAIIEAERQAVEAGEIRLKVESEVAKLAAEALAKVAEYRAAEVFTKNAIDSHAEEASTKLAEESPDQLVEEKQAAAEEDRLVNEAEELAAASLADWEKRRDGRVAKAAAKTSLKPSAKEEAERAAAEEFSQKLAAKLEKVSTEVDLEKPAASPGTGSRRVSFAAIEAEELNKDGSWCEAKSAEEEKREAFVAKLEEAAKQKEDEARVLVDMGFKVGAAHTAVRQSESVDEAANMLLEQENPTPSYWQAFTEWFTGDSTLFVPLGKYRILERVAIGATACQGGATSGDSVEFMEKAQVVEIVEVQVVLVEFMEKDQEQHVRGKIADGRWISIASTSGLDTWARFIPIVPQLMELGFSESQAREAAKRCSTMEGAVAFLTGDNGMS